MRCPLFSEPPPSMSDASDLEDSLEVPLDPPSTDQPSEETTLSPALSSWQDIVSAIKLKFEGGMIPLSKMKQT